MKRILGCFAALALAALSACAPTRKSVFPPAASMQELSMTADGDWRLTLRLQNNSYTGMRFQSLRLSMALGGHAVGTLRASPALDIPQFAADVLRLTVKPDAKAAAALAASAHKSGPAAVGYLLEGRIVALPDDEQNLRTFKVSYRGRLSPVPGIANTFR